MDKFFVLSNVFFTISGITLFFQTILAITKNGFTTETILCLGISLMLAIHSLMEIIKGAK